MSKQSPQRLDRATAAARLEGWLPAEGREAIIKTFRFSDFNAAFGWMCRVALFAEAQDHHPEWFNVYNRVDVVLATHESDGVTDKDITLARFMDTIASSSV